MMSYAVRPVVIAAIVAVFAWGPLPAPPPAHALSGDQFAAVDAELARLEAELGGSSDRLERRIAKLVGKGRKLLAKASKGIATDAKLVKKLVGKLAKAFRDEFLIPTPPPDSLAALVDTALTALADEVARQGDVAAVVADTLPDGEKKTTRAQKAVEKAGRALEALAAASDFRARGKALLKAAFAVVNAQRRITKAGGVLTAGSFFAIDVEGGASYRASRFDVTYVESTQTLLVETSALRSSGERHLLGFEVAGVGDVGLFTPAEVTYSESDPALFGAMPPVLDAECRITELDLAGGRVSGELTVTGLPALAGPETRTLTGGQFQLRDVVVMP